MNAVEIAKLAASATLGGLAVWAAPSAWFPSVFLSAIGATLLAGVASAAGAKSERPMNTGTRVLSFLFIGTSEPNAVT